MKRSLGKFAQLWEPWQAGLLVASCLLGLPILTILWSLSSPQFEVWAHLSDTVLSDYVLNSLILAFGVGVGTLFIGTGLAWVVVRFQFLGRQVMQWLVLLPLAMPAYIIAYTYTGMLDFAGPVQTSLRETFDWGYGDYYFPEVRSLGGAILMLTLVLYPYVYILARTAFAEQSTSLFEASLSLGKTPLQHFREVEFPLARPAIFTGVALAMMEAFADYGTVSYFGVNTFTTGIFRTWFGLGNQMAAAQLAALLCMFVLILLLLEKHSRRRIQYFHQGQKHIQQKARETGRALSGVFFLICCLPPLLGFIIPAWQLSNWALQNIQHAFEPEFVELMFNSLMLAAMSAIIIVVLALVFVYAKRLNPTALVKGQVQFVSLGYALPGTVIAVGALIPLTLFDKHINEVWENWSGETVGLIFSGSLIALVFAYAVRFLSVALHNVETGLGRIKPSMDDAARSLGLTPGRVLRSVHVPLLRMSVISAALLVFVDVLKELPATLIMRPFNFNTLAVKSYELASDERLVDAALPALAIVLVGLIPVVLLVKALDRPTS